MNAFRLNIKLGHILYALVILLATVLRFLRLGDFPLSNLGASSALQAAQLSPSASTFLSGAYQTIPQPAYDFLTRMVFQIFGTEDLLARCVPALVGVLLVATPLLAWKKIGFGHSLLMGFLLAIAPIFVTVSRTASGISLSALGFALFIMGLLGRDDNDQTSYNLIAGAGLGLGLTSGPYILSAFLSLGLAVLLWKLFRIRTSERDRAYKISLDQLRPVLITTVIAVFSFATGLGWSVQGLSSFFESIAFWIQGWSGASPFSGVTIFVIILTYLPMLLVLGLLGAWSSLRDRDSSGMIAAATAIFGLIVMTFYPARQPHDLLWVALPLAYLGSKYLLSFVQYILEQRVTPWVLALGSVLITLSFMAYIQLSSNAAQDLPIDIFDAWQTPFAFLTLMFVIVVFFGLGWSWTSAKLSVITALLFITLTLSVSAMWRLNLSSQVFVAKELWRSEVPSRGLELLVDTVESTSYSIKGVNEELSMELIGEAPPYLLWALREFLPHVKSEARDSVASPIILAKGDNPELTLQADYIGQTIAIGERWGWVSFLPPDFFKWWVKRNPPTDSEEWLVLIREDIAFLLEP